MLAPLVFAPGVLAPFVTPPAPIIPIGPRWGGGAQRDERSGCCQTDPKSSHPCLHLRRVEYRLHRGWNAANVAQTGQLSGNTFTAV